MLVDSIEDCKVDYENLKPYIDPEIPTENSVSSARQRCLGVTALENCKINH